MILQVEPNPFGTPERLTFKLSALFYLRLSIVVPGCIFLCVRNLPFWLVFSCSQQFWSLFGDVDWLKRWNSLSIWGIRKIYIFCSENVKQTTGFIHLLKNALLVPQISQAQLCVSQVIYQSKGNMFMLSLCLHHAATIGGFVVSKLHCWRAREINMFPICHDGYYNFFVSAW